MDQEIYIIGLNHRTADVEVREKFALTGCTSLEPAIIPVGGNISEVVILSTCNRVEIMIAGKGDEIPETVLCHWANARGQNAEDLRPYVYIHRGLAAVEHLFTVASSLDSMVLGEPQILGQLKTAYKDAVKRNSTKVILNRLLHKAFSVAKRVRTETAVASSAVSISYAAVELAKRIFGEMSQYKAMLIGAGEMAELAAAHLINCGIDKIYVANRTFERGLELAKQFNGEAILFDELFTRLADADIIISSTGAHQAIIRAKDIKDILKRRKNRPMFFIDIAVPRDIDPDVNNLDNIYLYDIDDLKEVVEENLSHRREEAAKAKAIVRAETEVFSRWLRALDLQPTIVDMYSRSSDIAQEELQKTLRRIGPVDDNTRMALEAMLNSVVKKIHHEPICFLKRRYEEEDSGQRYIDFARRMFNLDNEPEHLDAHPDRKRPIPEIPVSCPGKEIL
ncbi:glutamyl-tRNA reductase [Oleidesulfovibrio sp.]|uniref:glutamyl-tRNA reductase n=1 Tax=Oleidesulfovibrio sp. TaxID=2909707 RepID=UPI003A839D2C